MPAGMAGLRAMSRFLMKMLASKQHAVVPYGIMRDIMSNGLRPRSLTLSELTFSSFAGNQALL